MQQIAEIISIRDGELECKIQCGDACQGCAARRVCGTAESSKTISVYSNNPDLKVGDSITIEISSQMGLKAVLLAYLMPVFIIIALLLLLQEFGFSELSSGLIAIGAVAVYYLFIKIFAIGRSLGVTIVGDNKTI